MLRSWKWQAFAGSGERFGVEVNSEDLETPVPSQQPRMIPRIQPQIQTIRSGMWIFSYFTAEKFAARPAVSSKLTRQWHFIRAERSSNGSWVRGCLRTRAHERQLLMDGPNSDGRSVVVDLAPALPDVLLLRWSTSPTRSESMSPRSRDETGRRQAWKNDSFSKRRSDHDEARRVTGKSPEQTHILR